METLKDAINDKNLVILCATIIACYAMSVMGVQAKDIVIPLVTGMMGIAVGKQTA